MIKRKGKIRNFEIRVNICWGEKMAKGKGLKTQLKGLRERISGLFQDAHHQNQGKRVEMLKSNMSCHLCKEEKLQLR